MTPWALGLRVLVGVTSGLVLANRPTYAAVQRVDTTIIRAVQPTHPGVAMLREEMTLGHGSTDEEFSFTHAFLYAGSAGSIYVVDLADPRNIGNFRSAVRKYDRDGKFVRQYGSVGQGPGEYTGAVSDVQELPDGRVLVSYAKGVLVYSSTGGYLAQWKVLARGGNIGAAILYDRAGFVSLYGSKSPDGDPSKIRGPASVPVLHRFRLDGTIVDTTVPPDALFPAPTPFG